MQWVMRRYVALRALYCRQNHTNEELILRALLYGGNPRNIHTLSSALGENNIVGISDVMTKLHDTSAALAGAASTVLLSAATNLCSLYSTIRMPCWLIETSCKVKELLELQKPPQG